MVQEYENILALKWLYLGVVKQDHCIKVLNCMASIVFSKCNIFQNKYFVKGYKGKQVRDNIHSSDLINAFWHYYKNPKTIGEVYNIGGGIYQIVLY